MLQVILLILKIIGLVLLAALGLVILLLLAVLFVPIRYKAQVMKKENIGGNARVYWLLHILRVRFLYEDGRLKTRIKLLFFTISDSEKKENQSESNEEAENVEEKSQVDKAPDNVAERSQTDQTTDKEEPKEAEVTEKTEETREVHQTDAEDDSVELEDIEDLDDIEEVVEDIEDKEDKEDKEAIDGIETASGDKTTGEKTDERSEKVNSKKTIKHRKEKLNKSEGKQSIVKKLKNIYNMKNDEEVRHFLSVSKKRIGKIVRHILPRKLEGDVRFGLSDPASTGKVLGAVSVLYPVYAGHLIIEPSFEEPVFEGELRIKGRIRIFTVLVPALKLYFGKEFKSVKKKFKKAVR